QLWNPGAPPSAEQRGVPGRHLARTLREAGPGEGIAGAPALPSAQVSSGGAFGGRHQISAWPRFWFRGRALLLPEGHTARISIPRGRESRNSFTLWNQALRA